jgi:hypothetical protein
MFANNLTINQNSNSTVTSCKSYNSHCEVTLYGNACVVLLLHWQLFKHIVLVMNDCNFWKEYRKKKNL